MIRNRVEHRCRQLEHAVAIRNSSDIIALENVKSQYILIQEVPSPHTLESVSIATKECFVRSFKEQLPIFFQSGAIVPYEHILNGRYTEAAFAFLPIEKSITFPALSSFLPEKVYLPIIQELIFLSGKHMNES